MKISFGIFLLQHQIFLLMILFLLLGLNCLIEKKIREPSLPMSKYSELQARGETLQNNNNPTELRVYTRRKFHQTTGDNPAILEGQ